MTNTDYPIPVVGAFVFNKENKLLLAKSHKWHDQYMVLGGKVQIGESMEAALKREIREEAQIDIYDIQFLNIFDAIHDPDFYKRQHYIFINFTCKTDTSAVQLNEEAQEYAWVTLDEAMEMDINSYIRKTIPLLKNLITNS